MTLIRRLVAHWSHPAIRAWDRRAAEIRAARGKPGAHTGRLIAAQRAFVIAALSRK